MRVKTRSTHQIIEEQIQRWQIMQSEEKIQREIVSVITLSREPGSGGRIIAERLAKNLQYDLFDLQILHTMAESANISARILESLDERGLSMLEDWISSIIQEHHLWPDQYLHHLMKVIGAIGRHRHAVIVGRGANFILPAEKIFRVRIFAPLNVRARHVTQTFSVTIEEAKRRIIKTDSDRRAFVRKYFNVDISNPDHYDLLINTEHLSIEAASDSIQAAFERFRHNHMAQN